MSLQNENSGLVKIACLVPYDSEANVYLLKDSNNNPTNILHGKITFEEGMLKGLDRISQEGLGTQLMERRLLKTFKSDDWGKYMGYPNNSIELFYIIGGINPLVLDDEVLKKGELVNIDKAIAIAELSLPVKHALNTAKSVILRKTGMVSNYGNFQE